LTRREHTTVIPRLTKIIRSGITLLVETSRCLERKQPSRVGVSPLCDVVSSFLLSHTYRRKRLAPGMARPFMFAALC